MADSLGLWDHRSHSTMVTIIDLLISRELGDIRRISERGGIGSEKYGLQYSIKDEGSAHASGLF